MAIELYSWPRSSGTRVAWALEELGVPYKYVELDPKKKEHLAPAYLAVNPHGKVPALVDDGQRFFESGAILLHLGDKYGVAAKLWPAPGGQAHADALCWSVWAIGELQPYLMQVLYHGMDTPVSYRPGDRSKAAAGYLPVAAQAAARRARGAAAGPRPSARGLLARRRRGGQRARARQGVRARARGAPAHRGLVPALHGPAGVQARALGAQAR
ncbi:MAG: hypothetical protein A3G81_10010 [Betaproteobacteria bacterium RIFCSPLOWO2_12_FULL_65_14]|nr:MAG: hypothetical protein A3G81_10010 [Betaproteobacteria bacterium RIFCSPLOWO2_12_FULL_65_14]